jgi:hypothetical protein
LRQRRRTSVVWMRSRSSTVPESHCRPMPSERRCNSAAWGDAHRPAGRGGTKSHGSSRSNGGRWPGDHTRKPESQQNQRQATIPSEDAPPSITIAPIMQGERIDYLSVIYVYTLCCACIRFVFSTLTRDIGQPDTRQKSFGPPPDWSSIPHQGPPMGVRQYAV